MSSGSLVPKLVIRGFRAALNVTREIFPCILADGIINPNRGLPASVLKRSKTSPSSFSISVSISNILQFGFWLRGKNYRCGNCAETGVDIVGNLLCPFFVQNTLKTFLRVFVPRAHEAGLCEDIRTHR